MTDVVPEGSEPITAEGLESLRAELAELEGPARRAIAKQILAARDLGDLSENADYHIAKEEQAHLETRILRLNERLRRAFVVDVAKAADIVAFGASVDIVDEATGRAVTYKIVGPTEADAAAGLLSAESPVARALIGKRAGETAAVTTPGGPRRFRVDRISA